MNLFITMHNFLPAFNSLRTDFQIKAVRKTCYLFLHNMIKCNKRDYDRSVSFPALEGSLDASVKGDLRSHSSPLLTVFLILEETQ